eukprot:1137658-Pelagomonas_calceolata.AAC.3
MSPGMVCSPGAPLLQLLNTAVKGLKFLHRQGQGHGNLNRLNTAVKDFKHCSEVPAQAGPGPQKRLSVPRHSISCQLKQGSCLSLQPLPHPSGSLAAGLTNRAYDTAGATCSSSVHVACFTEHAQCLLRSSLSTNASHKLSCPCWPEVQAQVRVSAAAAAAAVPVTAVVPAWARHSAMQALPPQHQKLAQLQHLRLLALFLLPELLLLLLQGLHLPQWPPRARPRAAPEAAWLSSGRKEWRQKQIITVQGPGHKASSQNATLLQRQAAQTLVHRTAKLLGYDTLIWRDLGAQMGRCKAEPRTLTPTQTHTEVPHTDRNEGGGKRDRSAEEEGMGRAMRRAE